MVLVEMLRLVCPIRVATCFPNVNLYTARTVEMDIAAIMYATRVRR